MTDTEALKDLVKKSGLKYSHIASQLGITRFALQKKIENKTEFKASEIVALAEILKMTAGERNNIFLSKKMN